MKRLALTSLQNRFLVEHLVLPDFEKYLQRDRLGFLNLLVQSFRVKVPFNSLQYTSLVQRSSGVTPSIDSDALTTEILRGHGASCASANVFMADLLRRFGFDAGIIAGFPASAPRLIPSALHLAVVVNEKPGVFHYIDVGSTLPIIQAVPVDIFASEMGSTASGFVTNFCFITKNSMESFILKQHHMLSEKDVTMAQQLLSRISKRCPIEGKKENNSWIINFVVNDEWLSAGIPLFERIPRGVWFPYQIFPSTSPLTPERVRSIFGRFHISGAESARRQCVVSGFGDKWGDFVMFTRDRRVRRVNGSTIPMVEEAKNLEEHSSAFNEEFPRLTDQFRENLIYLSKFENKFSEKLAVARQN